ncbi:MAG: hypothetical protein LBG94_06590 [Treponema sp.]|jgi:hypothetical protein|nr:hypothetical protein [Treponema sp.]
MGNLTKLIQFIKDWFSEQNAGQKKRLAITGTIVFAAVLTISVLISMGSGKESIPESESVTVYPSIPAQELFLPDEPDFIPAVLLEREQRTVWNEQDATVYWQDPLRFGEEMWRERIEAAVDELLERVP